MTTDRSPANPVKAGPALANEARHGWEPLRALRTNAGIPALFVDKIDIHLALEHLLQRNVGFRRRNSLDTQDTVENRPHQVFVIHAVEFHQDIAVAGDEVALHDFGNLPQLLDGLFEQLRVL